MSPDTTPWAVRPLVNPSGGRLGVQIVNVHGELVAQVLGGSDDVLAMAVTLVSSVNAKPWNLELHVDAMTEQGREQAAWLAAYRAAQPSEVDA